MIDYYRHGMDKKLNQIVVAGSHDAGITGGSDNVQTQDLDIAGQAEAGVRVFDLRIAAATTGSHGGGLKTAALVTYHGGGKTEVKSRVVARTGALTEVERLNLYYGSFGLGLTGILVAARNFVTAHPNEFLILKFDKCSNWALIAEACISVLDDTLYKTKGNINNRTLQELKGSVIVLFTADGLAEIPAIQRKYPNGCGIHGIKNMYSKAGPSAVYEEDYDGIQYFGKGGTSLKNIFGNKIKENQKTQAKLMKKGGDGNPDVMGMMYWTSTGLLESIRTRNEKMWSGSNVTALKRLWTNGLSESIESRIPKSIDASSHGAGGVLKAFMPNIVMIDFADAAKCATIDELNTVAATALTNASIAVADASKRAREVLGSAGVI
jgi:hypothetical protein